MIGIADYLVVAVAVLEVDFNKPERTRVGNTVRGLDDIGEPDPTGSGLIFGQTIVAETADSHSILPIPGHQVNIAAILITVGNGVLGGIVKFKIKLLKSFGIFSPGLGNVEIYQFNRSRRRGDGWSGGGGNGLEGGGSRRRRGRWRFGRGREDIKSRSKSYSSGNQKKLFESGRHGFLVEMEGVEPSYEWVLAAELYKLIQLKSIGKLVNWA